MAPRGKTFCPLKRDFGGVPPHISGAPSSPILIPRHTHKHTTTTTAATTASATTTTTKTTNNNDNNNNHRNNDDGDSNRNNNSNNDSNNNNNNNNNHDNNGNNNIDNSNNNNSNDDDDERGNASRAPSPGRKFFPFDLTSCSAHVGRWDDLQAAPSAFPLHRARP